MTRRPKDIGTAAETAVLHVVQTYWPHAARKVLHGKQDEGDIGGCGPFVFEVKGGNAAKAEGPGAVERWMDEARTEAANAGRGFGILVLQRPGYGYPRAHKWWAYLGLEQLIMLSGGIASADPGTLVRLELFELLEFLARAGHVDPEAH